MWNETVQCWSLEVGLGSRLQVQFCFCGSLCLPPWLGNTDALVTEMVTNES